MFDWSVRCEIPAGEAGQVRHQRHFVRKEAHRTPLGDAAHPETEINHISNKVYEKSLIKSEL